MALRFRYRLTSREKDALLSEQAALIEAQAAELERRAARIAALEALLTKPKTTSQNSSIPPSQDQNKPGRGAKTDATWKKRARTGRPGVTRALTGDPDETIQRFAHRCPHCAVDVSGQTQRCRRRYDHMDILPIRPHVSRVELDGGRCADCGKRFCATPPEGMAPVSPFGASIHALLLYLHRSHHVGFERLSRMMQELFGLAVLEGAIANALRRAGDPFEMARAVIKDRLRTSRVIGSDETTARINGATQWQWVFVSKTGVLHEIAARRAKEVAQAILGDHRPEVWVSDRYAGQQDLGTAHQVCLAHVLRDVQYAIDCGDQILAPKLRDHLRWAIRVGRRRPDLADATLKAYQARAERVLDTLTTLPIATEAGATLQRQVKAWRTKFFVFLQDRDVPPTNNGCEQALRPSVVFRKVTHGFRSDWGAHMHACYRSIVDTARRLGQTALQAITIALRGAFPPMLDAVHKPIP